MKNLTVVSKHEHNLLKPNSNPCILSSNTLMTTTHCLGDKSVPDVQF